MKSGKLACTMLLTVSVAALAGVAMATPMGFVDDFTGPLDPAWVVGEYPAGHLGIIGGSYVMTALQGGGFNPKLQRFDTGDADPLLPYTHDITVAMNPFLLSGSGGTQSDFKWKSFGTDGRVEIVVNSFGNARVNQDYFTDAIGGTNLVENIPLTDAAGTLITDSDTLGLRVDYDPVTDTMNAMYSINGGAPINLYSGGGGSGPLGDMVSNFVEVEVFKWGAVADVPFASIDEWGLTVIPEPSVAALLGLGGLALLCTRRRR